MVAKVKKARLAKEKKARLMKAIQMKDLRLGMALVLLMEQRRTSKLTKVS